MHKSEDVLLGTVAYIIIEAGPHIAGPAGPQQVHIADTSSSLNNRAYMLVVVYYRYYLLLLLLLKLLLYTSYRIIIIYLECRVYICFALLFIIIVV